MFSLICVWIKGWENYRDAGDLRRYGAHYDVIVMNHSDQHVSAPNGHTPGWRKEYPATKCVKQYYQSTTQKFSMIGLNLKELHNIKVGITPWDIFLNIHDFREFAPQIVNFMKITVDLITKHCIVVKVWA